MLGNGHDEPGRGPRKPDPHRADRAPRGRPVETGSLREARRQKEWALTELRQMEVRKRRGELLDADEVRREWDDTLRTARNALLAVPSRVRQRLPHLTPQDIHVIDEEIRAALTALANGVEWPPANEGAAQ
jgi:terminase small subunit / prophage DNA-packing protein